MRRKTNEALFSGEDLKEGTPLPQQFGATQMVRESESSSVTDSSPKVKVLFYMHDSVIKRLKHLAIELDKSNSELAEDFIKAGLLNNNGQHTP